MIYGSLQVEFMETKHTSHSHIYGTHILSNIVFNASKPINNKIKYFGGCQIKFDSTCQVFFLPNAGLISFLFHSLHY